MSTTDRLHRLANAVPCWRCQEISNATKSYFDAIAQGSTHVQEVSGSLDNIHFMEVGQHASCSITTVADYVDQKLDGSALETVTLVLPKLVVSTSRSVGRRLLVVCLPGMWICSDSKLSTNQIDPMPSVTKLYMQTRSIGDRSTQTEHQNPAHVLASAVCPLTMDIWQVHWQFAVDRSL